MDLMKIAKRLCDPNVLDEYEEFVYDVNFDNLQDLTDILTYDTVDDFWEMFGELRCCRLSPRPDEYAYFQIDQASENFALSLVIPFSPSGQLSHCARLILETRTQELYSYQFCRDLSQILLGDVRADIKYFFEDPIVETFETVPSFCVVDHRFRYPRDE